MRTNPDSYDDSSSLYEYFDGDDGAGIGASHQTGWTGLVAPLIKIFGGQRRDRRAQAACRQILSRLWLRSRD
jgi:hypothetical protein